MKLYDGAEDPQKGYYPQTKGNDVIKKKMTSQTLPGME